MTVPISDFIGGPSYENSTYSDGTPACVLLVDPITDGSGVLGENFLRSAYVVYDLDNLVIAMGQSKASVKGATPGAVVTAIDSGTTLLQWWPAPSFCSCDDDQGVTRIGVLAVSTNKWYEDSYESLLNSRQQNSDEPKVTVCIPTID